MADALGRAGERALSYGAAGALAGSFIPVVGTALGAGIGAGVGALSGALSANEENNQLEKAKKEAETTLANATAELAKATAENRQYLSEVVLRARENLLQINQRQVALADEMERLQSQSLTEQLTAREQGFDARRGALTEQGTAEEGGLTAQESFLAKIAQLQQEGIAAREALTADEEAAARRITAPGGLLERQRQSNALAQARATQRARTGGPAARAAIMGQFATQGAELGMQAQRDIMAAQDRARQARAGLLGERTSASVAQQQGLSGVAGQRAALLSRLAGERGMLTQQQQEQYADYLNKFYGARESAKRARAQSDIDYTQGLGRIDQSEYEATTGMRSRMGDVYAQKERDIGDISMATRARALELDQQESARNMGLLQSTIPLFSNLMPSPTSAASAGNTFDKVGQAVNARQRLTQPSGLAGYGGLG